MQPVIRQAAAPPELVQELQERDVEVQVGRCEFLCVDGRGTGKQLPEIDAV
jgi:hypothetical protein